MYVWFLAVNDGTGNLWYICLDLFRGLTAGTQHWDTGARLQG